MIHASVALSVFVLVISGSIACRDMPRSTRGDSTATNQSVLPPVTGLTTTTGWDSAAGRVMIVAASKNPADAVIVLPGLTDSSLAATSHFELRGLANIPVELFSARGFLGTSVLRASSQASDPAGCVSWPTGTLGDSTPAGWKVALEKGKATGLPLDSIEAMPAADSARFVSDVVKGALGLADGSSAVFRGIPFAVRKGYRFATSSASVIIAEVVRKINEEANPREEHLLLVAERSPGNVDYRVGFHVRSAGAEESLETSQVLAAVHLKSSDRPAIVITFEYEEGGEIALLERVASNAWQVVWRSASSGC